MDTPGATPWSAPSTVAGFASGSPNPVLMHYASQLEASSTGRRALDIGCGAARNGGPLAMRGWNVVGLDLSRPMLDAGRSKRATAHPGHLSFALAAMDALPVTSASCDLVIAHGIWNLATTDGMFRRAVREAARASGPGAALFVFTFSRHTLPADAEPVAGETLVFTQFSGQRQCFLTEAQLVSELRAAGFHPDPAVPLVEHNRPSAGALRSVGAPVIFEAAFRCRG